MSRVIIILDQNTQEFTAWATLTAACRALNLPYHSVKLLKYPFTFLDHENGRDLYFTRLKISR